MSNALIWPIIGARGGAWQRGNLRELFGSLCHKKGAGGVAGWAPLRPCVYDAICRGKGLSFAKPNLHLTSEPKSLFYLAYLCRILEVSLRASVCNRLVKALWGFVVFSQVSAIELGKKVVRIMFGQGPQVLCF
ncbi:hypothetical protein EPI10_024066 [Gossypium australe]|uniref:Uncharacterized protein n=1 Tax=Gossypium australe TaxID=47621 RepID=A0A5B6VXE4_9ROSI|nr:hypothetical protein EPI10_024066 [Gossypium australe]